MWLADFLKKLDEGFEFAWFKVAKLAIVNLADGGGKRLEQDNAAESDADVNGAAVTGGPLALDEAAFPELVDQPGDVGGARDESRRKTERRNLVGGRRFKQPECVVLLSRQAVGGEELVFQQTQPVVSAPEIEKSFLLKRIEAAGGLARSFRCSESGGGVHGDYLFEQLLSVGLYAVGRGLFNVFGGG